MSDKDTKEKTQCQLCKRLAWPIIPHSWSHSLAWKVYRLWMWSLWAVNNQLGDSRASLLLTNERAVFCNLFPAMSNDKASIFGTSKNYVSCAKIFGSIKKNLAGSKTFLQCKKKQCKFFFEGQKYLNQYPPLLLRQPAPRCRKKEALHLPLFRLKTNQCLQTTASWERTLRAVHSR